MNLNHERIDKNTFSVLTDKGEEITYRVDARADDLDVFSFVFTTNELEYRRHKVDQLCDERKNLKLDLLYLRRSIQALKKSKYQIAEAKKDFETSLSRYQTLKKDYNILAVSMKTKVLKK